MADLILVVDDDDLTRMQLRTLLEQAGYLVAEATNGEQALAVYSQVKPDLVLLDVIMPILDGIGCCAGLRSLPGSTNIPILMITGIYDHVYVEQAFAVGATDYISKPIRWQVLTQRVQRLLEARHAMEELKQQTEQAQKQETQLRMALAAARMDTWDWDILNNQVTWSSNLKDQLGLEDDSLEAFMRCVHPEDRDFVRRSVMHSIQEGAEYDIEFRVILLDGTVGWQACKGFVFRDKSGTPVRMSGVNMDITKRKQAEEALEVHANQQALVAELSQMALAGTDLMLLMQQTTNFVARSLNVEYCKILELLPDGNALLLQAGVGWQPGQVGQATVGAGVDSLAGYTLLVQDPVIVDDLRKETRFTGPPLLHDHQVKCGISVAIGGRDRPFGVLGAHTTRSRTFSRDEIYFMQATANVLATAIERQRVEQELQRQNLRSKLFADITLKIRTSLQIDEVLQTSVTEVQMLLHADRVLIFRLWSDGSGQVVKEAVIPGIPAIIGQHICDPCFQESYIEKYRLGRIGAISNIYQADIELCYIKFLQQFSVQAYLVVPILLKNKLWGLLIAYQCTTPREWTSWETELLRQLADQMGVAVAQAQLLEQETRQREELTRSNEELQQFAFIASHDLQEPLRKIKTFGDRLKVSCSDALNEQARDYLERMQNAAKRMQALIEDLLTLSRVTTRAQPFSWVSLEQVTQEVLSDLEVLIQQTRGRVEVGNLPTIQADPLQIRQLMQNLIGNALKFHRKQEPPMVKIYSQPIRGDDGTEFCQIIVEDNGIGFDEKYLDRIFNVFQRLHSRSEYEGTGIGLAICRKIAERHHGSITASSTPGQGARFTITLPINADP